LSFYRLYRYELSRIGLLTFILALAALLLPQWLLKEETAGMLSYAPKRYEELFLASGSPQLFFILWLCCWRDFCSISTADIGAAKASIP